MTARRRMGLVGRLASGAAAVVVLVVGGAAPASADPTRSMSIDPADDVTTSPVATGTFTGASLLGLPTEQIAAVDLRVSPTGPTGGDPVTQDGCEVATSGECGTGTVSFTWEIPELAYNGPYVVQATAKFCDIVGLGCGSPGSASVEPITFRLGIEPAAPTDLKLQTGDDRQVEVSWARNGEPDILYYALFRKDPGGDFRRLGSDIKQPSSGRPTFTDTSAAATSGGDFAYKVVAVRKGFTGDEKSTKLSKASGERTINVVPPPTTTNPGDPPGGPVTTVVGQGVDIGSFLSGQAPTLPSPGPIFLELPDTGFGETLPFGTFPDEAEPGEEDAVLPTPRQRQVAEFKRNRPLVPVAAGLILLVMAGHVRLLNVRTRAVPEKPPPGTYVARALEAARANQAPTNQAPANRAPANRAPTDRALMPLALDVDAAVANGGHHRAQPDDDLAGLPVWAEFEPAMALGLLDAPDDDHDLYAPPPPPEAESEPEPEPAPVPVPQARIGRLPEAGPVAHARPESVVEPEVEAIFEPEQMAEVAGFAPQQMVEIEAIFEPEPRAELDALFEPGPSAEVEALFEPEPRVEVEAFFEPEPRAEVEALFEPEPRAEVEAIFEPEPGAEVEPFFEPGPRAEVEALFEPEPRGAGVEALSVPGSRAGVRAFFAPEQMVEIEAIFEPVRGAEVEVGPAPFFEPEPEPEHDRHPLSAFDDDEADWAANPEVFVGPRR